MAAPLGRLIVVVVLHVLALTLSPAAAGAEVPGPLRPLAAGHQRPLPPDKDLRFVDAAKGDDAADGSEAHPWRTIARAAKEAAPGITICLRAGVYYENVTISAKGTSDRPITLRAFPNELAILDGGLADFARDPAAAWEPCRDGAPGEYRSTKAYPGLDVGAPGNGDGEGRSHVFGHFADTMVPLQAYRLRGDLQSDNPYWNVTQKVGSADFVYCGPGIWYDIVTKRIHCRFAPTKLPGLGNDNYRGPSDPRTVRLVVAGRRDRAPLTLDGAQHVRLQDLVLRGAAGPALLIERGRRIEIDGLTVYGGASGITAKSTHGLRVAHTAIRGIFPAQWDPKLGIHVT